MRKPFFTVKTQDEVSQAGCRVSILGDTQNLLTGYGPEQPSLGETALSQGVGLDDLQRTLLIS